MLKACNFVKKETLARVFSSEFYETSKNTFSTEHLGTTASVSCEKLQIKFQLETLFSQRENLQCKSSYYVRIRKKTDQKKLQIRTLFAQCLAIRSHKIFLLEETLIQNIFPTIFCNTSKNVKKVSNKCFHCKKWNTAKNGLNFFRLYLNYKVKEWA